MKCPNCQYENETSARFCSQCGTVQHPDEVSTEGVTKRGEQPQVFPEKDAIEYESSRLRIPLFFEGEFRETLELNAFLRMGRDRPRTDPGGFRQFEFQILQWEAIGQSEALGGVLTFTLSDAPQPRSICLSQQRGSDFPAAIIYNAIFDVYLGQERVLTNQTGLGVGTGVTDIPPRVDIAYEKAFEFQNWRFAPGACVRMQSMPIEEFQAEVHKVQAIRASDQRPG